MIDCNVPTWFFLPFADLLYYITQSAQSKLLPCYFDYLLLNRPIIHFTYDYDYYKNKDRGLYYDLKDVNGGRIVYNYNELINSIEMYIRNPKIDEEIRIKRKNEFLTFDNGGSSQYIIKKLLKNE